MHPKITTKNMELLNNTSLLYINNSSAILINPFLRGAGIILTVLNNMDANSISKNLLRRQRSIFMQKKVKITMVIMLIICFSEGGRIFILF
jgi:hypothetical protein